MPQASPQVENGYTRIANEFLEALIAADYPASVLRFMLVVMRETWGWQRKASAIPTKRFVTAFGGVTDRRVQQIRDDCLRHNLIEVEHGGQFDVPVYSVQKHYTDWLTWKSLKPWNPPSPPVPSRKEEVRTETPDTENEEVPPSEKEEVRTFSEAEGSLFKDNVKYNQINNDSNDSEEDDDGQPSPPRSEGYGRPKRLGETGDLPILMTEFGNLWAACKSLPWADVRERWLQDVAAAVKSTSDTWLTSDKQAADLLRDHPPKGDEKYLPSKWLSRVEAEVSPRPARGVPRGMKPVSNWERRAQEEAAR